MWQRSRRVCGWNLGENGCFPGERTPRVLWTGLEGDLRRMSSLAGRLEGAMVRCGFPEEHREFAPHVTVGRVRSGTQKRVLAAIGQRMAGGAAVSRWEPRCRSPGGEDRVDAESFASQSSDAIRAVV